MRTNNNLVSALQDDGANLFLVTAAQLKEFALNILEEAKAQNIFVQDNTTPAEKETIIECESKDLLTAKEVCKKFNISEPTLWRWGKKGLLLPIMVGGRRRYSKTAVDNLLA